MLRVSRVLGVSLAIAFVVVGCSDDKPDQPTDRSGVDQDKGSGLARYCALAAAYDESTNVDTSTVQSTLDGLEAAATAARDIVAEAPSEVRTPHERLATAAELLV